MKYRTVDSIRLNEPPDKVTQDGIIVDGVLVPYDQFKVVAGHIILKENWRSNGRFDKSIGAVEETVSGK